MLEIAMTENAEGTAGDLAVDLAGLRQDAARLAETVSKLVQQQTQAAGQRVSEAVGDAREKIAGTEAQHRVCAASSAIGTCIGHHPLTSMLIAFVAGMSLGPLIRSCG
jgi:ElaB/YqjD/DUF883 family membrane-anchored ribosome-binding protein